MSENKSIPISPAALAAFAKAAPAGIPGVVGSGVPATPPPLVPEEDQAQDETAQSSNSPADSGSAEEQEGSQPTDQPAAEDPRFEIRVLSGFCTRLAGSTCDRCMYVCPYNAISFAEDGSPLIDAQHCSRCALCCGICDAFATERITMNDLIEKARRLSADGDPVIFTCYDQIPEDFEVHPNVIVLPCIGAVPPEFWASVLEVAPNVQIYCNFELCTDCPTAGPDARALFTHAVNTGEKWSQIHMGKAERLPEKTDILSRFFDATSDEFQRRGIATSLVNEVEDIASGRYRKRKSDSLIQFHKNNDHFRAQGHVQNLHHRQHVPSTVDMPMSKEWPRLHLISKTVQEHPEMAPRIPRYLAAVDESLCEHCYEPCFSHCPAGARTIDDTGTIHVDPLLCIACGNCALYCPIGAAYLFETDASIFLENSNESETQNSESNQ